MPLPCLPAFTGPYTVLPTDTDSCIRIGGGYFYELTFGDPSGYVDEHYTWVTNLDTNSGKRIYLTGGTGFEKSFILWPHQTCFVHKTIDKWAVFRERRYKLWDNSLILYVDAINGNDNNDGLSTASALKTPGQALTVITSDQLDLFSQAAPQVTIQLMDAVGTPYKGIHFPGPVVGKAGNASILMQGNATDNTKTTIGNNSTGGPIALFDNALIQLKNVYLQPSGGAAAISMLSQSMCWLMGNVTFGDGTGPDMFIADDASLFVNDNYSKTGNASYHVQTITGGKFTSKVPATISFNSNSTFNTFSYSQQQARQEWGTMSFNLGSYAVTGTKWYADTLSLLGTNGVNRDSYFPGSVNGSFGVGGAQGDY